MDTRQTPKYLPLQTVSMDTRQIPKYPPFQLPPWIPDNDTQCWWFSVKSSIGGWTIVWRHQKIQYTLGNNLQRRIGAARVPVSRTTVTYAIHLPKNGRTSQLPALKEQKKTKTTGTLKIDVHTDKSDFKHGKQTAATTNERKQTKQKQTNIQTTVMSVILPMPELLVMASCRKGLEEGLCWLVPRVPHIGQGTELNWRDLCLYCEQFRFLYTSIIIYQHKSSPL